MMTLEVNWSATSLIKI